MSFPGVTNPFSTPVGKKIEQATDASLRSENLALNMEICDIINSTADGPEDAIKAIRKRLTQRAGKTYTVVMNTITVLETCVENCGCKYHSLRKENENKSFSLHRFPPDEAMQFKWRPYNNKPNRTPKKHSQVVDIF